MIYEGYVTTFQPLQFVLYMEDIINFVFFIHINSNHYSKSCFQLRFFAVKIMSLLCVCKTIEPTRFAFRGTIFFNKLSSDISIDMCFLLLVPHKIS